MKPELTTTRSAIPSPLKSAVAIAEPPLRTVAAADEAVNVPSPVSIEDLYKAAEDYKIRNSVPVEIANGPGTER